MIYFGVNKYKIDIHQNWFLYRIGSIIQSILTIIDGLISLMTFGFIYSCLAFKFNMFCLDSKYPIKKYKYTDIGNNE